MTICLLYFFPFFSFSFLSFFYFIFICEILAEKVTGGKGIDDLKGPGIQGEWKKRTRLHHTALAVSSKGYLDIKAGEQESVQSLHSLKPQY